MQVNAMAVGADGAAYVANDAGLYRTDDQGASWVDLQLGIPVAAVAVDPVSAASLSVRRMGFQACSPVRTPVRRAAIPVCWKLLQPRRQSVGDLRGTSNGVVKNIGGSGWQPTSEPDGHLTFGSVVSLALDPSDVNHVYAGSTNGFFTTTSGGAAWTADPIFYGATVIDPTGVERAGHSAARRVARIACTRRVGLGQRRQRDGTDDPDSCNGDD